MYRLHDTLRYSFVWVHRVDVLEAFRSQCVGLLQDHHMATHVGLTLDRAWEIAEDLVPRVPQRGDLNIEGVLDADYFFA